MKTQTWQYIGLALLAIVTITVIYMALTSDPIAPLGIKPAWGD
jgi:hypothetical protein